MPGRKHTAKVYKQAEFIQDAAIESNSTVPGFAINCNMQLLDSPQFRRHFRSDFLMVMLIIKGHLTISINLEEYSAGPNSLILATPHALKQLVQMEDDVVLCGMSATADFLSKQLPDNKVDMMSYFGTKYSPHWQLDAADATTMANIFTELLYRTETFVAHPYGKELFFHAFSIFLYELGGMGQKYAQINHADFSRKENLVMSFTGLVQQQFRKQRNVQQYAEQLHITPKYLTETVKEISGNTAGEIIDSFVILEAKRLLSDTPLSILQVAEELNFSDQSFFGKFFKRHVGYSPKEYRSMNR